MYTSFADTELDPQEVLAPWAQAQGKKPKHQDTVTASPQEFNTLTPLPPAHWRTSHQPTYATGGYLGPVNISPEQN